MSTDEIIRRIREHHRDNDEDLFPGCDDAELKRLAADVKKRYRVDLPGEYLDLLRKANGVNFDGLEIHASRPMSRHADQEYPTIDGIVEANEGMKLDDNAIPNGLAFGTGDMGDFYGLDIPSKTFTQYDVYRKPLKRFASFDDMVRHMFESRLGA